MKRSIKVLSWVLLGCFAFFLCLVGAGVWWFRNNKEALKASGEEGIETGRAFGRTSTKEGCLDRALAGLDACDGLMCRVKNNISLTACLKAAPFIEGYCDDVPETSSIWDSATWRTERCQQLGRTGNDCAELFGAVQKYCEDGSKAE